MGFEVVEALASRHGGVLKAVRGQAMAGDVRIGEHRVGLVRPITFYNECGRAVGPLVRRHGIEDLARLVVVHDELDLPVGRLKIKQGGGLAGNNGLKSLQAHLHTADFTRIRVGIGKPPGRQSGADYVLRKPGKAERTELDISVAEAADAVEAILLSGVPDAMNTFNRSDRD